MIHLKTVNDDPRTLRDAYCYFRGEIATVCAGDGQIRRVTRLISIRLPSPHRTLIAIGCRAETTGPEYLALLGEEPVDTHSLVDIHLEYFLGRTRPRRSAEAGPIE